MAKLCLPVMTPRRIRDMAAIEKTVDVDRSTQAIELRALVDAVRTQWSRLRLKLRLKLRMRGIERRNVVQAIRRRRLEPIVTAAQRQTPAFIRNVRYTRGSHTVSRVDDARG